MKEMTERLTGDGRAPAKGRVRMGASSDHVEVLVDVDGDRSWSGHGLWWRSLSATSVPATLRWYSSIRPHRELH
jgi:hypothetical protein